MHSGGTYSHTAPHLFQAQQSELHPDTVHPSHKRSDQIPSDLSVWIRYRSSASYGPVQVQALFEVQFYS